MFAGLNFWTRWPHSIDTRCLPSGQQADHIRLVVSRDQLNFEADSRLSFGVLCRAATSNVTFDATLTVDVLDVNEAPEGVRINMAALREGGEVGDTVARVLALDPEGDQVPFLFFFFLTSA